IAHFTEFLDTPISRAISVALMPRADFSASSAWIDASAQRRRMRLLSAPRGAVGVIEAKSAMPARFDGAAVKERAAMVDRPAALMRLAIVQLDRGRRYRFIRRQRLRLSELADASASVGDQIRHAAATRCTLAGKTGTSAHQSNLINPS